MNYYISFSVIHDIYCSLSLCYLLLYVLLVLGLACSFLESYMVKKKNKRQEYKMRIENKKRK